MNQQISNRRRVTLALVALAVVGGISIGVIGDRLASRRIQNSARITTDLGSVLDDLSLTKEQRIKADSILEKSAPRTEEAMFEIAARLRAISDSVDIELRSILTPTQRSKLESLRRRPIFLLKRQQTNGTTSIDTVYRDAPRR
jgi:Spy/CpxP family protein refolding chaperone